MLSAKSIDIGNILGRYHTWYCTKPHVRWHTEVYGSRNCSLLCMHQGVLASESWREAWRPSLRWIQKSLVVRDRDENLEDPLAVHCFSVCSRSTLLGDLGVSRFRERDLLSVLLIYPRIFSHVFIAYHLLVGFLFVWLYSTICSCVLVVLV